MSTHNICFHGEIRKKYQQYLFGFFLVEKKAHYLELNDQATFLVVWLRCKLSVILLLH